jgi:hypothetical protein
VQQASATETQPQQPQSGTKLIAAAKTDAPATVAAVEPLPNSATPASQPADIPDALAEAGVPEPTARPLGLGNAVRRTLRKSARKAPGRRRLIVRRRVAPTTPDGNGFQFGYQNSLFHGPAFESAPSAFQRPQATNQGTARNSANGNSFGWASSQ